MEITGVLPPNGALSCSQAKLYMLPSGTTVDIGTKLLLLQNPVGCDVLTLTLGLGYLAILKSILPLQPLASVTATA